MGKPAGRRLEGKSQSYSHGIWYDGTTMWAVHRESAKIHAYRMHEMAGGAHVDARRVQVYLGQLRWQTLPLPYSLSHWFRAPLTFRHHIIPSSIAA